MSCEKGGSRTIPAKEASAEATSQSNWAEVLYRHMPAKGEKKDYRTTTAQSQSLIRRRVLVGTPFPSSENNPNNRYLHSKCFQKRMKLRLTLCWKRNSQKLNYEGRIISQFPGVCRKQFVLGNPYVA
jgi:hypothetical protein